MRKFTPLFFSVLLIGCTNTGIKSGETTQPEKAEAPKSSSPGQVISCSNQGDSRILQVETRGSGCNLNYTKGGRKSSIATAANGLDHCEKVADKIRTKLGSSGFSCQSSQ